MFLIVKLRFLLLQRKTTSTFNQQNKANNNNSSSSHTTNVKTVSRRLEVVDAEILNSKK
ncbi:hypothetical protein ACFX5K_01895 [Rickettsiales bacterium LUAb2]